MKKFTIRTLTSEDIPSVIDVQQIYSKVYPEARVIPGELYLSPGFENGQNVFCAFDENRKMAGYAPLYPVLMRDQSDLPHTFWTEIKVHPADERGIDVKDGLFEQLILRTRQLARDFPGHPIHLTFQYFPSESASIDYVISKGCHYTESVFTMRRDLSREIQAPPPLSDVVIRPWRMESEAEQQAYVTARNECFPEALIALEEWQYLMKSPQWSVGTSFAAFREDQLIGNAAVFWDEAENRQSKRKIGFTEYIFVLLAWRGKNIARHLITAGLGHLKQHRLDEAQLEVRAQNE